MGEVTRTNDPTSVSLPPVLISRWLAEVLGTFCHGAIQACLGNWRNWWGVPVVTSKTAGLAAAHTSKVSQIITDNNSMWQPCTAPESIMAHAFFPPHHMYAFCSEPNSELYRESNSDKYSSSLVMLTKYDPHRRQILQIMKNITYFISYNIQYLYIK